MIHNLSVAVTFPSSGFTIQSEFQPPIGITAVVGPNGSGKTLTTIEATRYLLYGKKALRGAAADYKTLDAFGRFTIGGKVYDVTRNAKLEQVVDVNGKILAVNAEAVTQKMTELMGYGLDVFDVCNASTQGKGDLFGKKKPAERKRMIDQVVGLASNEVIEKACRAEANVLKREAEALSAGLVVPVGPTAVFQGRFSDEIEAELLAGRKLKAEVSAVERKLVHVPTLVEPDAPWPEPQRLSDLEEKETQHRINEVERARLRKIADAPKPDYDEDTLEAASLRLAKRQQIEAAGPKPVLNDREIEHEWSLWTLYQAYEAHDEVQCPNCSHRFSPSGEAPKEPQYKQAYLREQTKAIGRWEGLDDTLPDGLDLSRVQIANGLNQITAYLAAGRALEALKAIPATESHAEEITSLRASQTLWDGYLQAKMHAGRAREQNEEYERQLEAYENVPSDEHLTHLAEQLATQRVFESQWAAYNQQKITYDAAIAVLNDKRKLADEFKRGGEGMADARREIKAFLAPALSREASKVLSDMTGGQLESVSIDDDMNIMVGSQTLDTLSGGGATAANIALRVALGKVLVGDSFPVLLADEMDADVDTTRRETMMETLVGLKSHLKQIILVTHRDVALADNVFHMVK